MCVGAIMLVVSIFGAVGAFKESTLLTNLVHTTFLIFILIINFYCIVQYGCLLTIVFILEVAAAVYATLLQGEVREMLTRTMKNALEVYPTYEPAQVAVDFMQRNVI